MICSTAASCDCIRAQQLLHPFLLALAILSVVLHPCAVGRQSGLRKASTFCRDDTDSGQGIGCAVRLKEQF